MAPWIVPLCSLHHREGGWNNIHYYPSLDRSTLESIDERHSREIWNMDEKEYHCRLAAIANT